jgi:hypothetical protein
MPNQPKTATRSIRIEDELWAAALAATKERGDTISDVVRKALSAYVRAGSAILVAVATMLVLAACGGREDAPAGTVTQQTVDVPQVAESTSDVSATTSTPPAVESKPLGEAFAVGRDATLKVTMLEPGVYAAEMTSSTLVTLDGEFIAVDSAGVEHAGASRIYELYGTPLSSNGIGGDQITFDTADIVSITYTGDGGPFMWTA